MRSLALMLVLAIFCLSPRALFAQRLSITPPTVTIMEGDSGEFTVVLSAEPTANVTVTIVKFNDAEISLDKTELTFTPLNWNVGQTVRLMAAEDEDNTDDEGTVILIARGGGYDGDGVIVRPRAATIDSLGKSVQLNATIHDQDGSSLTGVSFDWSSADSSVAVVDSTGKVTAVDFGETTITAALAAVPGAAALSGETAVRVASGTAEDRAALVALYNATDGPNWVNNANWLTGAPLGEWHGVETDGSGRVVRLELAGRWYWDPESRTGTEEMFGLRGPIPPEIGNLEHLRELDLSYNFLTEIPPEIGNLSRLEFLNLGINHLWGPISEHFAKLGRLRSLILRRNQITGQIPRWLGDLVDLETLNLRSNQFSGAIPAELGNLSNLRHLNIGNHGLSGPIPAELGRLERLHHLDLSARSLHDETLSGPIPAEFGNLVNLTYLNLDNNALSGPIPAELGNLAALRVLSLRQTRLSGPLPSSLLRIPLRTLWFSDSYDLCVPGVETFVAWIEGVEDFRGSFCNDTDRSGLEDLFELAGGSDWTDSDGWLGGPALAQWSGVSADSLGRVTALDLSDNGLAGRLPYSLALLSRMADLRLGGNSTLSGVLPLSLQNLPLRALHYGGTGLCAPQDESFVAWLNTVPSHEGTGEECILSDRDLLVALYEEMGGPDWYRSRNWLTDAPLYEWEGVTADEQDRVLSLYLAFNNLNGLLSPAIGRLANLEYLDIGGNDDLTGGLPSYIGSLANLEYLSVSGCGFQTAIPPEIGGLENLRVLNLNTPGMSGSIPAEIGHLTNLEELIIGGEISGAIPPEIGRLSNLKQLVILQTRLSGPVPASFGDLANIEVLDLRENFLSGPIPSEMGRLAKLVTLNLSGNNLTGMVPPELGRLTSLIFLDVSGNGLSGLLPGELGGLATVEHLNFTRNDLIGGVPPQFGSLSNLRDLLFNSNGQMSGSLPTTLTNLSALQWLDAGNTGLCAPTEASFLAWLGTVPTQRVRVCGDKPASAYLVQAVQSRDFPVPLVAGEEAILRVFPTAALANQAALPPVRATFFLNGSLARTIEISGKPGPIPTTVSEGSLGGSLNALVPADLVRPGLEMVVEIDPGGTLEAELGVARRVPDSGRLAIDVRSVPLFELTLVPFILEQNPDSSILAPITAMADDPENHELLRDTRTLLPVESLRVRAHEPVITTTLRIHIEVEAIRVMEGGTGHFMAMMSPKSLGHTGGGLAFLGGWSSFSAMESEIIAHELGHNMSLEHAPCGGTTGIDPAFPYQNGNIGAWGYDHDRDVVVPPGRPDLMSYCGPPDWISDYYFSRALRFRKWQEDRRAAPSKSLLLWGGVDAEGEPFLEPSFLVDALPALPDSAGEYRVTGHSADGDQLFSLSFAMPEIADADGLGSFVFSLPVRPEWEALTSITLSGPDKSVTLDGDSQLSMAVLRNPTTGQIRGFLRDVPLAAAQAAADSASGVGATGLEVVFSRGVPSAEAWRR